MALNKKTKINKEFTSRYKRKILIKNPAHSRYSAHLMFPPLKQFSLGKEKRKEKEMLSPDKLIYFPSLGI